LPTQIGIAQFVTNGSGMLTAIYLDDQSLREADEIGDVIVDRHLPPKFVASKMVRTEKLP
jgi:hypothetical protein